MDGSKYPVVLIPRKISFQKRMERYLTALKSGISRPVGSGHCPICKRYFPLYNITPLWELFTVQCEQCIKESTAWTEEIIHRDLSPDDVTLVPSTSQERFKPKREG